MKTAISVPDELYLEADQTAHRLGWSRSKLYAEALREYLARQGDDPVTVALNAVADAQGDEVDLPTLPNVGRGLIESGAWEW